MKLHRITKFCPFSLFLILFFSQISSQENMPLLHHIGALLVLMSLVSVALSADVAFAVGTESTPSGTVSIFLYSPNTGQQT